MTSDVRLRLNLATYDGTPFRDSVKRCEAVGLTFSSLASLGDTDTHRRQLHTLNRECSRESAGRGRFESYDDYAAELLDRPEYSSDGTIVALDGDAWVGMVMLSVWGEQDFLFNEMTGVIASHRRRGIAMALKALSMCFAQSTTCSYVFTFHDPMNTAAIALNRRFGFVVVGHDDWWPLDDLR